jgi:hypothetical protein
MARIWVLGTETRNWDQKLRPETETRKSGQKVKSEIWYDRSPSNPSMCEEVIFRHRKACILYTKQASCQKSSLSYRNWSWWGLTFHIVFIEWWLCSEYARDREYYGCGLCTLSPCICHWIDEQTLIRTCGQSNNMSNGVSNRGVVNRDIEDWFERHRKKGSMRQHRKV